MLLLIPAFALERKNCRSLGVGGGGVISGRGQQSCHLAPEVCVQTEQSFVMIGKQDIFTARLPVCTAEHLSGNVCSEFFPVEWIVTKATVMNWVEDDLLDSAVPPSLRGVSF